jgi:hypothetical protein
LIEIKTPPVKTESALRHALQSTLQAVLAAADVRGKRLVPFGTPLSDTSSPIVSEGGSSNGFMETASSPERSVLEHTFTSMLETSRGR